MVITLFLHPKGVGSLGIQICSILPFLGPSTKQAEASSGTLGGLVGLLQ